MTLQAAIDAELPFLRAEAAARMKSRAVARRVTDRTTQNESTGEETPIWEDTYDGPFRLDSGSSSDGGSRGVSIGGITYEEATAVGHFPAGTDSLADNDLVDVTGETTGVWRIVKVLEYDQKTAVRLPIVQAARPAEWS